MKQLQHIAKLLTACVLLVAIMFPSVASAAHIFEDHEHTFCGNYDTHLHEQEIDCDVTKILVPTYYNTITLNFNTNATTISTKLIETSQPLFAQKISHSYLLRGPPIS